LVRLDTVQIVSSRCHDHADQAWRVKGTDMDDSNKRFGWVRPMISGLWYLRRLVVLVAIVVAVVAFQPGTAMASESAAEPPAPEFRYTVTVVLPEFTGDNLTADLLVEVFAKRLIDRGFLPGRGCDCLIGDADVVEEVRAEINIDYPGAWDKAFHTV
jgi:hypothetical protein